MSADEQRTKVKQFMEADFLPIGQPSSDQRIATALEYAAFHLGQIDKKLEKIIGLIHGANIARK